MVSLLAVIVAIANASQTAQSEVVDLALPTDNEALFSGGGADFYQWVERVYKGVKSTPWEGGQYGFVRDPVETAAGIIYTRFHEGIDIRCVHRDARGEPLDEVRAIADGKVVHANAVAGHSNYGKYIVIEHNWSGCMYYSLYGHLSAIAAQVGQEVHRGEPIATMGHTGAGITQERAHLHLEIDLMLSRTFQTWYDTTVTDEPNRNGIYNGINLAGLDVARFYFALRKNPALTIPEFLAGEETFYKVTFPRSAHFDLPKMYPWMVAAPPGSNAESWEVSFTRSGLPIKIEPSEKQVNNPRLSYIKDSPVDYSLLTQRQIAGTTSSSAHFTESGRKLMRLFICPD